MNQYEVYRLSTKDFFQSLIDRPVVKSSPRIHYDSMSSSGSLLSSDGEKIESLKRSLQDMQDELKELHSALTLPKRVSSNYTATRLLMC